LIVHPSHSFVAFRHGVDERDPADVTEARPGRRNVRIGPGCRTPGFAERPHDLKGEKSMQARIKNPAIIFPEAAKAMQAFGASSEKAGVPSRTIGLIQLRASQINGCSSCADAHPRYLKQSGETEDRLFAVAAWRDAPYFTDAERAALALAEAVTRLSDRTDPVSDEIWDEAARHYDEPGLAALLIAIATINVWNRLNVATRQQAGGQWG
jgi:AhpD family alkylhydroperoxidase